MPCIFALDRRKLGYLTKKKVPVSAFAILNFEGAEVVKKQLWLKFFEVVLFPFFLFFLFIAGSLRSCHGKLCRSEKMFRGINVRARN